MFKRLRSYSHYIKHNFLTLAAAGCVLLLIAVQILLLGQAGRSYLSLVDRLEGEPLANQEGSRASVYDSPVLNRLTALRESSLLTVTMLEPASDPQVFVTVNGEPAGHFVEGEVAIKVYDGDYVEINASAVSRPVRFRLATADDKVAVPPNGLVLEGKPSIITVGKIKFR
ncbi:hypothetical protein [Propionispora hippei]|uniref:Uncharacterized protein n=1 Tax=Propionispora hippei DSM 15287 TaxID=1123003 RepID=A0A1M6N390_9FIRM|nr:hypothetical protein [Propionispora hippei]SHJ90191.1 hypothetical protein SAMN02745170_03647 [Propionispora hippei DSM 15287]